MATMTFPARDVLPLALPRLYCVHPLRSPPMLVFVTSSYQEIRRLWRRRYLHVGKILFCSGGKYEFVETSNTASKGKLSGLRPVPNGLSLSKTGPLGVNDLGPPAKKETSEEPAAQEHVTLTLALCTLPRPLDPPSLIGLYRPASVPLYSFTFVFVLAFPLFSLSFGGAFVHTNVVWIFGPSAHRHLSASRH